MTVTYQDTTLRRAALPTVDIAAEDPLTPRTDPFIDEHRVAGVATLP